MGSNSPVVPPTGASTWKPVADASRWIIQHAQPYEERPISVLRELIQNAIDSMLHLSSNDRLVEVAILPLDAQHPTSYHLAVRDSGTGMTDEELRSELGILGRSTKLNQPDAIGEFGVGFYATHAICTSVAVVTRKIDHPIIGWRYVPARAEFERMTDEEITNLSEFDFDSHPRSTRCRTVGTSVYLALDLGRFPKCAEWLGPEKLAQLVTLDCIILPGNLYVADYSNVPEGAAFNNFAGLDISNTSLSLVYAPWECEGEGKAQAAKALLSHAFAYTPENIPDHWTTFDRPDGKGYVRGFLCLGPPSGTMDLYVKRMRVETAPDITPAWAMSFLGHVDVTPGGGVDVLLTPARDHIRRDSNHTRVSEIVTAECTRFLCSIGSDLVSKVQREAHAANADVSAESVGNCSAVHGSSEGAGCLLSIAS